MTEKHMKVMLQVLVFDCIIRGGVYARLPQISKVEECAYRAQLLMNVYVKMKAFRLARMIKESNGEGKYTRIATLNDIKLHDAAR